MGSSGAARVSFLAATGFLAVALIIGLAGQRMDIGYALLILSVLCLMNGIACQSPLFLRVVLWVLILVFGFGTAEYTSLMVLGYPLKLDYPQFTR